MPDRQADSVRSRTNAVRLHRRTLRRRVLRRTRRAGDVLDLVLRHIGREIRHVPEDAEDFLVAQADVMEERDDREAPHVGHVLVVLDLGQEVVHARWESGDADFPDVLGLERRLLRLEDAADLREVSFECREDVVVDRQREALLDVSLDRVPHDAERLRPTQRHIPAVHALIDQLPGRIPHRVRESEEVREMESETTVLAPQVHAQFRSEMEDEVVGLRFEALFRGDRLVKRVAPNQVRVADRRREDSRDGVGEELRQLVRDRDGDPLRLRASLEGVEHPRLAKGPRAGVRGFEENLLQAHFLGADEGGGFQEERILREGCELHAVGTLRGHKSPWRGTAKRASRPWA